MPISASTSSRLQTGAWVGDVDGINVAITAPDGTQGGSVAYPTNSTARLPEDNATGTKYEFFFDLALYNVRRALVDAAIAEFDRCFSKLPPGRYAEGELERLCPFPRVSRDQQKQTCLVTTTKSGRRMSNAKMQECVVRQMAKIMAGKDKEQLL
jgi:hypothetical protein